MPSSPVPPHLEDPDEHDWPEDSTFQSGDDCCWGGLAWVRFWSLDSHRRPQVRSLLQPVSLLDQCDEDGVGAAPVLGLLQAACEPLRGPPPTATFSPALSLHHGAAVDDDDQPVVRLSPPPPPPTGFPRMALGTEKTDPKSSWHSLGTPLCSHHQHPGEEEASNNLHGASTGMVKALRIGGNAVSLYDKPDSAGSNSLSNRTVETDPESDPDPSMDHNTQSQGGEDPTDEDDDDDDEDDAPDDDDDDGENDFSVQVQPESEADLQACPRILTLAMMQQIHREGLPDSLLMNKWERCFAIGRDGDSFITFLDKCAMYPSTLVAIRTTQGHVLGGFACETWQEPDGGFDKRHSYYGRGQSFLFANHPTGLRPDCFRNSEHLTLYPWTGSNDYCQICQTEKRQLGMGGGDGSFGWIVSDDFSRGQTGPCGTFGNPSLVPASCIGLFEIADLEVYGLVPLVVQFTPPPPPPLFTSSTHTWPLNWRRQQQSRRRPPASQGSFTSPSRFTSSS